MEELLRKREDFGDISSDMQILEAERARLSLLEEKIKEVLIMLRALNSTVRADLPFVFNVNSTLYDQTTFYEQIT